MENRPGSPDFGGAGSASVTDANVVLEGATPVGGNGTWLVSARRTYYDLVAGRIQNQNFPSFADLQLRAGWEFGPGHRLTLTGLRSVEDADLDIDGDREGERAALGSDVTNSRTINGDTTVSPRLAASYALGRGARIRVAGGLYTQSPGYEKLTQSDFFIDLSGARERGLRHEKATHVVVGLEQAVGRDLTARVEGYYKRFNDLLLGRLENESERLARVARYDFPEPLRDNVPTTPRILSAPTNDAEGTAYGLDLFLSHTNDAAPLTGWLSYAWGRATRDSYGRRYAFEYDRRHAFNAVGRYRLTGRWDVAATLRLASGFPHTAPVGVRVAAVADERGRLVPGTDSAGGLIYTVDYGGAGNLNGARLSHYARVDARGTYRRGRWSLYIEVLNLLGRDNAVVLEPRLSHDPDSVLPRVSEIPAQGFPRIPTFGLRARF